MKMLFAAVHESTRVRPSPQVHTPPVLPPMHRAPHSSQRRALGVVADNGFSCHVGTGDGLAHVQSTKAR
jgi:hypothetical protein